MRRTAFHLPALVPLTLLSLAAAPAGAAQQPDVLLRGGTIVDGTGAPARTGDVAITGDRITFVGDAARERVTARRVIDARGLFVAPGFIDPHTHTLEDLRDASRDRRQNAGYLMQGVTTVIAGNDGGGPLEVGETLDRFVRDSIGTNAALYVGFGSVRSKVLGMSSSAADDAQLARMRAMVAKGMDDGALGLSTGLYYAPQSYSSTEEVVALAREAASRGGVYDSHLRDESSYTVGLVGAVAEALRIGREGGLPVHIAHVKALGTDVWGRSDTVIASAAVMETRVTKVIEDDVSIGHFNVFTRIEKLSIGDHTRIGVLNIFRGGKEISIGRYCDVLRLNEINSIPEPDAVNETDPRFLMGNGSMIGASHKIDFTDRVEFGKCVILGGRNSSLWTHNRQMTKSITIGDYTYLGSEIRIAPGASIPAKCIVGMGSVVSRTFAREYQLIAGVPAAEVRELGEDGKFLTERKTRNDLPDDI